MALSPAFPPSVCKSDYRQVAKQNWLAALDAVDRTTPRVSEARIAELEQEEAPLDQPGYLQTLGEKATVLRLALWRQPDYVAWQIRQQTTFLRRVPEEIDRTGSDKSVDQRFNQVDGDIRGLLVPLYRDVFRLGIIQGGVDWLSERGEALRAIDVAMGSLIDVARCDTKKAQESEY